MSIQSCIDCKFRSKLKICKTCTTTTWTDNWLRTNFSPKIIKMNRGEIRKKADLLLGLLHAEQLVNCATDFDNRVELQKALDNVNNSGIDWNKDVVNSVREYYKQLMNYHK